MNILITGSMGLVGSEAAWFFLNRDHDVYGVDNDMRKKFFGPAGSVRHNMVKHPNYHHYNIDIRESEDLIDVIQPDVIIHAAAQPSHDWAATDPILDFDINARGTLILLEACRQYVPEAVFIQVSTNKVYGDRPNSLPLKELKTRYTGPEVDETMPVDNCLHSLFGVSKLSGDLLAQEYGRYFGLKTGIFRCGCITGGRHAGVELHGFLSYIGRCKKDRMEYKIYGYKGKQVRDNIHAYDLIKAFSYFIADPRPGEVYNMGGGKYSNISVLEALAAFKVNYQYLDLPRKGDHIYYVSNLSKFEKHYPRWKITKKMGDIIEDIIST